jgi:outer membrane receptor protein involved in Fe transport
VRVTGGLSVTPGLRIERYGADDIAVEPRVASELAFGAWTARATLGRFSRTQDTVEIAADHLRAERATQASAGIERRFGDGVRVGVTAFASWLDRLAVYDPIRATETDPLAGYTNAGTGTVRGLEVRAELHRDNVYGWLAYTFSQSRRVDGPGAMERAFDQDQPHNLVAVGSYRRGRWRFGARFRLASGVPDTPITGSVYVADLDTYRPLYGKTNSVRLPSTHQLDLRVDRELVQHPMRLTAYLDLANVYANPRVSGYAYNFDYRERSEATELPLTPSIGLRGEL